MLELIDVSKRFGELTALHPTSLSFPREQTTVLLGTSGCGKSTLLKMALGLLKPTTGHIEFDGVPLTEANLERERLRIGYVVQQGGLFPHLTARENLELSPQYQRWSRERIANRIGDLAELTRLPQSLLDRFPAQLSGGQQQRISLMRALILDPELLLLDEPLGALDPIVRGDLQTDLREIFRRLQKTVILVTHDLHEAAFFADQIVLLHDGRVNQRGTLKDLIESPQNDFVIRFIHAQRTTLSQDTSPAASSLPGRE